MRPGLAGVLLAGLLGCSPAEDEPIKNARKFVFALQTGDTKAVLSMLDERTLAELQNSAERASNQIGGRRNIEAEEMIQVVDIDPTFQIAQARVIDEAETSATVVLVSSDGKEHTMFLLKQDGSWRVRLQLPPPK